MDALANPTVKSTATLKPRVSAAELLNVLTQVGDQIKVLSLDCFDTIIWRKTTSPIDAFYDMHQKPHFNSLDLSTSLRARIESDARRDMAFQQGRSEVNLHEIYRAGFPALEKEQLTQLEEEELSVEHQICYAFPPLIELIRAASARKIKIIIVSDTYFTEKQLRHLLASKLPEDAMRAIDKIYCSCEHGKSKAGGLLKIVSEKINVPPKSILHIGDNEIADYESAKKAGMHATQLIAYDTTIGDMLRMQIMALSLMDHSIRHTRALYSPFRGVFAAANLDIQRPESLIGYVGVGPIMYAFAKFIEQEVKSIEKAGKKIKVLFLMRDAYLPALACNVIFGENVGHHVRISRFASYAASFRTKNDVESYLVSTAGGERFIDIAKQLLLPENMYQPIIKKAKQAKRADIDFIKQILQPNILQYIFKESKKYRERLERYLIKETNLRQGDTLMFVDLGYSGTAQRLLEPVLKEDLGVEVIGRYLIQLNVPNWKESRRGLIDASWCDERVMNLMVTYIALLEQICTSSDRSIVDYDEQGNPIFSEISVSTQQHEKLKAIQDETIRFTQDTEKFLQQANSTLTDSELRDIAAGGIMRLIFFPNEMELKYLQSFQFDLNLGTSDLLKVFDEKAGLEGLRKRGLFFMEKNLKSMRTNYPAELRSAGLELVLSLMVQLRFGFTLFANDFSFRAEELPIILMNNQQSSQTTLPAKPTHDGYFSLYIPIGTGGIKIGIVFGKNYKWVQLDSAELIKTTTLFTSKESEHTTDASPYLALDQMEDKGGGLFECQSPAGLVAFIPPATLGDDNLALRIVFRPIVLRDEK